MTLNLDTFVGFQVNRAKDFQEWWRSMNEQDPDNFPLNLEKSEWYDHWLTWCCGDFLNEEN